LIEIANNKLLKTRKFNFICMVINSIANLVLLYNYCKVITKSFDFSFHFCIFVKTNVKIMVKVITIRAKDVYRNIKNRDEFYYDSCQ